MARFTVLVDGVYYAKNADGTIMSGDLIDELAAYENLTHNADNIPRFTLEELGELVNSRPPCKVGDTVYNISSGEVTEMQVGALFPSGFLVKGKLCNAYLTSKYTYACVKQSDFGKTVFMTHAEAEAALSGVQHER